jgi:hypothetical protein
MRPFFPKIPAVGLKPGPLATVLILGFRTWARYLRGISTYAAEALVTV